MNCTALFNMKTIFAILMAALLVTGCSRRYTITTNSGGQVISHGKPKLEGNVYVYTDHQGRPAKIPAGRVREIAPSSMVSSPSDKVSR